MNRDRLWPFIDEALQERIQENRMRSLQPLLPGRDSISVTHDGHRLLNFSSNDYLGLSKHPLVAERAAQYLKDYGAGATASRLISGSHQIHHRLEEKIATLFNSEAAILFNSGFQANSTILQTLTDRHSLILADKLSHNSLIQGGVLSRATFRRYEHNELGQLEEMLQKATSGNSYNRLLILTETVFSMDGDRSDLDSIIELALKYDAMLYVDDAHAVGVWGKRGQGLAAGLSGIDLVMGTFGKAFGVFGSYITCSAKVKEYLINFCPGFIYTTALPPQIIGAIDAALDLVPELDDEREDYHSNIQWVRGSIQKEGFDTGNSSTQIIPLIIGNEEDTVLISSYLYDRGILAPSIRPPTIPNESSRIRLTLSSKHTPAQIQRLLDILKEWHEQ